MNCKICGNQTNNENGVCDNCANVDPNNIQNIVESEGSADFQQVVYYNAPDAYQQPIYNTSPVAPQQPIYENTPYNNQPPVANYSPQSVYPGQPYAPNGAIMQPKKKHTSLIVSLSIIFIVIMIGICAIAMVLGNRSIDFNTKYSDIAYKEWCSIASDGSWMEIDTNPDDIDSDYLFLYYDTYLESSNKIEQINLDLGFSTSLYKKMESTTALQGKQTEENDRYRVTWTYHPDHGLEVLYEKKK